MANLLSETIDFLAQHDRILNEVIMFCGNDFQFTRAEFEKLADREYDNGYGGQEVASDLKLVGADWWIERHEYDGAENWVYKEKPSFNKPFKNIQTLMVRYGTDDLSWSTLAELNEEDDNID